MITRRLQKEVEFALKHFPVAVILGARQVGKTTLALSVTNKLKKKNIYLDLENPYDKDKLHDAYSFLDDNKDKLVVIDEVQQMPELFSLLRSLTDKHRKPGRFLLTGSASPELIKGASQTLAGRAHYMQLQGISLLESGENISLKRHWFREDFLNC